MCDVFVSPLGGWAMGWNCTVHFEVVTIWTDLCWSAEKVSTIEAGFASSRDGER